MIQTKLIHICSEEVTDAECILNSTLQEIQRDGHHIEDIREISIKGVPRVAIIYDDFTAPASDAGTAVNPEPLKEGRPRMVISTTPSDGKFMIVHHVADVADAKDLGKYADWSQGYNGDKVAGMDDGNVLVIDILSDSFLSDKIRDYVNVAMASARTHKTCTTRFTIHEALIGTSKSADGETSKYIPGKIMSTVVNVDNDVCEICKQLFEHTIAYMASCGKSPRCSINEGTLLEKIGVVRYSDGGLVGRVLDGKYIDNEAIIDITAERSEIQRTLTDAFVRIKPTLPISGFRLYTLIRAAGTEDCRLGELICTIRLRDGDKTGTETLQDVEDYIVAKGKTYKERTNNLKEGTTNDNK